MSEDKKNKETKQKFFRINSQGELTETEKSKVGDVEPEQEPQELGQIDLEMENSPTEVGSQEPGIQISASENTEANLFAEPKTIDLNETLKETVEEQELFQDIQVFLEESQNPGTTPIQEEKPEEVQPPTEQPPPNLLNENLATLKSYISLKEKEVYDLKEQQKQYQNVLLKLKRTHAEFSQNNLDLQRELETAKSNEQLVKKEIEQLREKYDNDIAILKNDFEQQRHQNTTYHEQLKDLNRQKSIWKEKISEDLKKIKIKEKELENRYELLKLDTETLLDSKDQQILELRKKIDAFELELESLEERLRAEHAILNSIGSKKRRLIETLKLAITLLEQMDSSAENIDERKTG